MSADPQDPIVEAIGLSRSVETNSGTITLLDSVDLAIGPADRVGFAGPSGSGKSLTLRAIAMLDPVDRGEVLWRRSSVAPSRVPEFRRDICYVPQRMATFEGTVRETLQVPFRLASWTSRKYDEQEVVRLLATLKRAPSFLDKTARELSGGESQVVRLLLSLSADPSVLLLDEPTAAMDGEMAGDVETLIQTWVDAASSRAFIWISHSEEQLARVANRRVVMKGGRLGLRET